jgi:hypothetical protein
VAQKQVEMSASSPLVMAEHGAHLMNALWMRPGSAVVEIIENGLYYKKKAVLEREQRSRNLFTRLFSGGGNKDDPCATSTKGYWFDKLRLPEALGVQWVLANGRPKNRYPNGTKMKDQDGVDMEDRLSDLEACVPCVLGALRTISKTMAKRGCTPFYK